VILADTSVWVEHLRRGHGRLAAGLHDGEIVTHPMVIGELACGVIRNRREILALLGQLPSVAVASDGEALTLIERHRLTGRGIGWVDAHLLTSVLITGSVRLWTLDRRLLAASERVGVAFTP
jgi:predicted nucleic acid-binding protein